MHDIILRNLGLALELCIPGFGSLALFFRVPPCYDEPTAATTTTLYRRTDTGSARGKDNANDNDHNKRTRNDHGVSSTDKVSISKQW